MFQLIGILLVIASLWLIPANNFFKEKGVIIGIMMAISIPWVLFSHENFNTFLKKRIASPWLYGLLLWVFTVLIKALYDFNFNLSFLLQSLVIILIPIGYISILKKKQGFHWADIFLLLYLFLIAKTKIVSFPLFKVFGTIDIKYDYILIIFLTLGIYQVYRGVDIGYKSRITPSMLGKTLLFSLMIPINSLIGIFIGYISYSGFQSNLQTLFVMAVMMFFFGTLIEEIFFRGLFHNYFQQFFKKENYLVPLLLSTLIFGLSHFAMGYKMIILASIAGFFYGLTYVKTNNIYCAALIHTLTNLSWQLLFVTLQ